MKYQIKKLETDDICLVQQLLILFKKVFDAIDTDVSELPDPAYLKNILAKDGFYVLSALAENRVVGGLTAYVFDMYLKKDKEMYLYDLAVDEDYRRQGVAGSLINALREHAKKNNVSTIFVEAHIEDVGAINFYKSMNAEMEEVRHFNISTTD